MCSWYNVVGFAAHSGVARIMGLLVASVLVAGLLAACGSEPQSEQPAGGESSPAQAAPEAPQLTPLQVDARELLAERLSAPVDSLVLVSDEAVQWADASLGCPQEGMGYAQAIVPGRRITFSHNGDHYEVHTSDPAAAGSRVEMVSCEGGISY